MHKKIMILIFALTLVGLPLFSLIFMPKEEFPFSENENRYLATFPQLTPEGYKNKKFMEGFDSWSSDMFIGRERWINIKNNTEQATGKMEISGVFTFQDRMMQVWKDYDADSVEKNLDAINSFAVRHKEVPMFFMLIPTSAEIYKDTLAKYAIAGNQLKFISECEAYLENLIPINVSESLIENRERYIYYRTDHHWTSLGAYLGYQKAAKVMGFGALDIGRFNIEHASNDFRGTLYSKTLNPNITPDVIDYYILSGSDPKTTVSIYETGGYAEYPSIYFREYLDKKDKYASFLGQNTPILNVKSELDGNNSRLLIFKDSYAHSLIPFLSKNYSEITVCDMRYINVDYNQYIDVLEYDQVIFIYNVVSFSEDTHIRKLNLGESGA